MGMRWRVAIVDDHERSRAALRGAIWAGGEVVGEAVRCPDAVPLIRSAAPDVAVFAVGLPDGDGVEAAAHAIATTDRPAVPFTRHTAAAAGRAGAGARPRDRALRGEPAAPPDARGTQDHRAREGGPDDAARAQRGGGVPPPPPGGGG